MSRQSDNVNDPTTGYLTDGFDYINQAWVVDGRYVDCAHPPIGTPTPAVGIGTIFPGCNCYGREHAGERCTNNGLQINDEE